MRSIVALVAALIAGVGCSRPLPPVFPGGSVHPIHIDEGHLLVTVMIDGEPHVFVLDTAASITSLRKATAAKLGLMASDATSINNDIAAATTTVRALSIGAAHHRNVRVAIVDMPGRVNRKYDGILGIDVLGRHDLVIDMARSTLAIHPAGAITHAPITSRMERVALDHGPLGLILFEVTIRDHGSSRAVLDLGAPNCIINRTAAALSGIRYPMFRARKLTLGGLELVAGDVTVRDLPVFARLGVANRPAILIGTDVFENRILAIGYRDRVAFVSR